MFKKINAKPEICILLQKPEFSISINTKKMWYYLVLKNV